MEVTIVVIVSAGQAPHPILRAFEERDAAPRWAGMLHNKGLSPVTVDCERIEHVIARSGSSGEEVPEERA